MTSIAGTTGVDSTPYMPFVDGLRAISIAVVVAYHAGVPGLSSGFVGVDVFFVISGYLIITQIRGSLASGRFALGEFWARRTLRILPSYLLVVAACLLVAPLILVTPAEFEELGREAQYSALMVVNYYFLASTGYFDVSGELKPLLHLWSLSVEEQFYLVAPLLLIALYWLQQRARGAATHVWTAAIGAAVAISFLACVIESAEGSRAFFLMPYRAWEFALGGMIPLVVPALRKAVPNALIDVLGVAGLALILVAATALEDVAYPSFYAAVPVLGACLVTATGLARPASPVAQVLGTRPLVWVGLISYAWYLWHWPLLSFGAIHNLGVMPDEWRWGALAISFLLAAATYHWLEVPIRRWRLCSPQAMGWRLTGLGAAGAVAVSLCGLAFVHLLAPAVERQQVAAGHHAEGDWTFQNDACRVRRNGHLSSACIQATQGVRYGVLIGNSHARMIYGALHRSYADEGHRLIAFIRTACTPFFLPDGGVAELDDRCTDFYRAGVAQIAALSGLPDSAILSARWNMRSGYTELIRGASARDLSLQVFGEPLPKGIRRALALGVGGFVDEIRSWGIKRVLIVGPVPEFPQSVPECLARAEHRGMDSSICGISRKEVDARRRKTMKTLNYVASRFPGVRVLDPIDMFCDASRCWSHDAGGPFYTDGNHLSIHGAERLFEHYKEEFAWAIAGEDADVEAADDGDRPAHGHDGKAIDACGDGEAVGACAGSVR